MSPSDLPRPDPKLARDARSYSEPYAASFTRQPPYSRELLAALSEPSLRGWCGSSADGSRATLFLLVGPNVWPFARASRGVRLLTLLPPGEAPEDFSWGVLAGHDPVLLVRCGATEGALIHRLVRCVLTAGVNRIIDTSAGVRYVAQEVRGDRAA